MQTVLRPPSLLSRGRLAAALQVSLKNLQRGSGRRLKEGREEDEELVEKGEDDGGSKQTLSLLITGCSSRAGFDLSEF